MARLPYNIGSNDYGKKALIKAQNGTIDELIKTLETRHTALMVRPTGFGKTFCMMKLCRDMKDCNRILYMYPTDIIKQSIITEYVYPNFKEEKDANGKVIGKIQLTNNLDIFNKNKGKLCYIELCSYKLLNDEWNSPKVFASNLSREELSKLSKDEIFKLQEDWLLNTKLKDFDLLILDEAHRAGANGFMSCWSTINKIVPNGFKKNGKLNILGATATPMRTDPKVDIEKTIFCYHSKNKGVLLPTRISDISFSVCWDHKILSEPYYTKCILDLEAESKKIFDKLEESMLGVGSDYHKIVYEGHNGKKNKQTVTTNAFSIRQRQNYTRERAIIQDKLKKIRNPVEVIKSALDDIDKLDIVPRYKNGKYARYIVFYDDTDEMMKNHKNMNELMIKAYDIGGTKYHKLNTYYLASNTNAVATKNKEYNENIVVNSIKDINNRDLEIKLTKEDINKVNNEDGYQVIDPETDNGKGEVDIIHSIDILNMGYHVGHVTGVIVKRKTSSEIKYYQQLGRCMSTQTDHTPLIIDLVNADAELYEYTKADEIRQEAAERIKSFISKCHTSEDFEINQEIFDRVRLNNNHGRMPKSLINELYFDRKAPIYFIYAAGKAIGYETNLKDIIKKLYNESKNRREKLQSDEFNIDLSKLNPKLFSSNDKNNTIKKISEIIELYNEEEAEDI